VDGTFGLQQNDNTHANPSSLETFNSKTFHPLHSKQIRIMDCESAALLCETWGIRENMDRIFKVEEIRLT
jgi:hypothetical protein